MKFDEICEQALNEKKQTYVVTYSSGPHQENTREFEASNEKQAIKMAKQDKVYGKDKIASCVPKEDFNEKENLKNIRDIEFKLKWAKRDIESLKKDIQKKEDDIKTYEKYLKKYKK